MIFGGYRTLWLIAMFDLPTKTAVERSSYIDFRRLLLVNGFVMLQYSVYTRHCASEESAVVYSQRIQLGLPQSGEVRLIKITDKQFGRMKVFAGKKPAKTETPPEQIMLL